MIDWHPFIKRLNDKLAGIPEGMLTFALLTVALVLIIVAATGSPMTKALSLAWVIAP